MKRWIPFEDMKQVCTKGHRIFKYFRELNDDVKLKEKEMKKTIQYDFTDFDGNPGVGINTVPVTQVDAELDSLQAKGYHITKVTDADGAEDMSKPSPSPDYLNNPYYTNFRNTPVFVSGSPSPYGTLSNGIYEQLKQSAGYYSAGTSTISSGSHGIGGFIRPDAEHYGAEGAEQAVQESPMEQLAKLSEKYAEQRKEMADNMLRGFEPKPEKSRPSRRKPGTKSKMENSVSAEDLEAPSILENDIIHKTSYNPAKFVSAFDESLSDELTNESPYPPSSRRTYEPDSYGETSSINKQERERNRFLAKIKEMKNRE